jgi:phosphonate ABC transporter permease subunit PhnE
MNKSKRIRFKQIPHRNFYFIALSLAYILLIFVCLSSFIAEQELSMGRNPIANLLKTTQEFIRPSFIDIWFGDTHLEYKSDDGKILRTENRKEVEKNYIAGLARATWTTIRIATLGSLLAALFSLPLAVLASKNLGAPTIFSKLAQGILDISRSIHTLVFGLVIVGIIGLGPTAGILAIAFHSTGTYGKLFVEAIESLDMAAIDAVRSVGANRVQVFRYAVLPAVLPQFVSSHLYIWEFNIRDSTILGIIGAGGLGQLITEATSLFQWGRLSTVLIVVFFLVISFSTLSQKIRTALL